MVYLNWRIYIGCSGDWISVQSPLDKKQLAPKFTHGSFIFFVPWNGASNGIPIENIASDAHDLSAADHLGHCCV